MYFTISAPNNRSFTVQSTAEDLAAFKTELAAETVGYLTSNGKTLIMIEVIRNSVITLAPYPPNEEFAE